MKVPEGEAKVKAAAFPPSSLHVPPTGILRGTGTAQTRGETDGWRNPARPGPAEPTLGVIRALKSSGRASQPVLVVRISSFFISRPAFAAPTPKPLDFTFSSTPARGN